MKVLLVKAAHVTPVQPSIIPPLGLLYLAGYLKKFRPQHDIEFHLEPTNTHPNDQPTGRISYAPDSCFNSRNSRIAD